MPRLPRLIGLLCVAASFGWGAASWADEVADVSALYHSGKAEEAIARADRDIKAKPRDAAMRFLRGVMLMETKRAGEAMEAFTALTQDFPNLAEPYNNLGVLLSREGRYDEARIALETAIRNNPSFALAHENLGDVYAALAAQSYARSSELDPAGASARPKLALIRQLLARPAS